MLRQKIADSIKISMKAREELKTQTLRLVMAKIKDKDIEAEMAGKPALTEPELLGILQGMLKQRQESIAIFEANKRQDLADKEKAEVVIIESFMPKQMSEDEAKAAVAGVVKELGASSIKDMGRVMAAVKEKYAGAMDMGKASGYVKAALGA
ncbi:MAG: GatB/YqeY domain-containing protein [Dongiaceae bacterium]